VPTQRASWEEQLTFAQTAAEAVDPDALLVSVRAWIYSPQDGQPLQLTFEFAQRSGSVTEVRFLDTDMAGTVETDPANGGTSIDSNDAAYRERAQHAVEATQLSAFEVLQLTEDEGRAFSVKTNRPYNPRFALWLDTDVPQRLGASSVWIVTHGSDTDELYIVVDAQTGTVLARATSRFELYELGR
jgi:hypothetical protein